MILYKCGIWSQDGNSPRKIAQKYVRDSSNKSGIQGIKGTASFAEAYPDWRVKLTKHGTLLFPATTKAFIVLLVYFGD